jgi:YgiT-type zinc finger domain-containing protein
MKCVICKHGEIRNGTATITLERNGTTFVAKSVPARVCNNCGEEYIDQEVAARLFQQAEEAANSGVQVHIREYLAA